MSEFNSNPPAGGYPTAPGSGAGGGYRPGGYGPPATLESLPWDRRSELGFVTAMVDTVKLLVTEPKAAFARVRMDGDYLGAFLFALILGWIMALVAQVWSLLLSPLMTFGGYGDALGMSAELGLLGALGQLGIVLVFYPFALVFGLFISAGIYHLILLLIGGLGQSEAGFEGTFKVVCYGQVATLGHLIPIVGALINLAIVVVLAVIGLEQIHRCTTVQAVAAVLIPFFLCCVCMIVMFMTLGTAALAGMAGM